MTTTEKSRIRFRRGTRAEVEQDGNQTNFTVIQYAAEPFYDTTDGHVWISDGTSKAKIDARGIVINNGNVVTHNNEVVID